MPKSTPYLHRRGDTFAFRIAVPADLRPKIGAREITKALGTTNRCMAVPMVLSLAAQAKQLFIQLRGGMGKQKKDGLLRIDFGTRMDLRNLTVDVFDIKPGEEEAAAKWRREALADLVQAASSLHTAPTPIPAQESPIAPRETASMPMLSAVIEHFLRDQGERGIDAMMDKHNLVLPIFQEIVGDKSIDRLRQADILDFFGVVNRLPTYAKYDRERGMSYREIANLPGRTKLSKPTFDRTYRASVATFLDWSRTNYQDTGFPASLTVEKIEYRGDRKDGGQAQRALTVDELKRLFEGAEMRGFASDPTLAHKFWLPHIALFTGARVNEICQMNPQTDIRQDSATGIWYFRITEDTAAHEDVKKSVKTGVNRDVPIHAKLAALGLLSYIERMKSSGAKLLFPAWKPRGGRAAKDAGEDFIDFLKEIGLHGVTNEKGRAIRGSHAFRHTILSYGKLQKLNLRCITGHKEKSNNEVADGYEDETIIRPLAEKKRLLDQLDYGLDFFTPRA